MQSLTAKYKSLPLRIEKEEVARATVMPKSRTTFEGGATSAKLLAQVRSTPPENLAHLARTAFTGEEGLIPALKHHIFKVKDEEEIRKLALFFSHYVKGCQMDEILKYRDEIRSIDEKCRSKMEHVPFEARLKLRFKEFFAEEIIRLFKGSLERNLIIYEKYCLGYLWFTDFPFIAHAMKEEMSVIKAENHPYVGLFLVRLAIYSDIADLTFKKYLEPLAGYFPKEMAETLRRHSVEELRQMHLSDAELRCLELRKRTELISWEQALHLKRQAIKEPLKWSQVLSAAEKWGQHEELASFVAEDLKTSAMVFLRGISLAHLSRNGREIAKHWNVVTAFTSRVVGDSVKRAEFMVEVAHKCFLGHDLESASALTTGLKEFKGIAKLSKKAKLKLDYLLEKFDLARQFENLRREIQALERRNIPYIPYLPLIRKEIAMIDNGNPDFKGTEINEEKLKLITRTFENFVSIQSKLDKRRPFYTDVLFELSEA